MGESTGKNVQDVSPLPQSVHSDVVLRSKVEKIWAPKVLEELM